MSSLAEPLGPSLRESTSLKYKCMTSPGLGVLTLAPGVGLWGALSNSYNYVGILWLCVYVQFTRTHVSGFHQVSK